MRGDGQQAALVLQVALGHLDRRGGGGVIGRAGLQQADDLCTAITRALHDLVDLLLGGPAHLDEVRHRNAGHCRVADERHHGVAVAAQHEGRHVLDGDIEFLGEEVAEARGVQHAGHADDPLGRQAAILLQRPDHHVERVGDADDEGIGGILLDARTDRGHDLEVDAEQVVTAHAGLPRHTGGHDADIGAGDGLVGIGARQLGVEALDRARLGEVQRLALRQALGDVENDDVAQFLEGREMRKRAADHAAADQSDFLPSHVWNSFLKAKPSDRFAVQK